MIFLDSWVWLEYVFEGTNGATRKRRSNVRTPPTRVASLRRPSSPRCPTEYGAPRDAETASEAIEAIRAMDHVEVLPVTDRIAEFGAELRDRYYQRRELELSYADAIHVAMAASVTEVRLCTRATPTSKPSTKSRQSFSRVAG